MPDVSTIKVVLPQTQLVTISVTPNPAVRISDIRVAQIIATAGGGGGGFTLNGTSSSVSISAGAGIITGQANSTITINAQFQTVSVTATGNTTLHSSGAFDPSAGLLISGAGIVSVGMNGSNLTLSATTSVQTSTVSVTALGNTVNSTSGTFSNVLNISGAGEVSVGVSNGTITISAPAAAGAVTQSFSGGGTSITGAAISVALFGGNNISLASASGAGSLSLTFNASSNALSNVSLLNASSGALSISAGAGIGIGQAANTITISASVQTSSITGTMAGNTLGAASTTATIGNAFSLSGAGIVSVGASANTITISATTAASANVQSAVQISGNISGTSSLISTGTLYLQAISMIGLSQSTTTGTGSTTSNVISVFGPTYSAGGGLLLSTTGGVVSYSQTAAPNFSLDGTSSSVSISAGAGIGTGQANSTITISASVQTSSLSVTALGNTLGAASTSIAVSNALNISGAGIVSVGMNGSTITISATTPSVTNYSTISGNIAGNTALSSTFTIGNTFQISLTGGLSGTASGSSITLSGGAGGAAATQSLSAVGISVTGTAVSLDLERGANISLQTATAAGALTVTISAVNQTSIFNSKISYTQNFNINEAAPVLIGTVTATGTTAASAAANPFGSSLSLQRIYIPAAMTLTEVDLAFGVSFPATNQGQGSISQSFILYSFGNSTSLASSVSASRAVSWATGTSTSGTSSSLQQGWASNQIQPFTFASSSVTPGEYVVAHLMSWAAASTSWTISVFGAYNPQQALLAGSVHTASASSSITAFNQTPLTVAVVSTGGLATVSALTAITQNATNNVSWFVSRATSAVTSVASATSSFTFLEAPFVGSLGLVTGSFQTASAQAIVISSAAIAGYSVLGSGGLSAGSFITGSTGLPNFAYNGSFAMTTSSTQASYLSGQFEQGIMATGSSAASIDLKSSAVTVTGSLALVQPWFALVGS